MAIPSCEALMNQDRAVMANKQSLLEAYEDAYNPNWTDKEALAADQQLKANIRQLVIDWVTKTLRV
jgi:hypothetical protein